MAFVPPTWCSWPVTRHSFLRCQHQPAFIQLQLIQSISLTAKDNHLHLLPLLSRTPHRALPTLFIAVLEGWWAMEIDQEHSETGKLGRDSTEGE
ncbi:hypothetical protein TRIATDRAFT_300770 [Trichoderma atroviride IMI 206040]|uniref:Uncharacterized protein n=1 Tax=Hypocrea atroviridis (strain ATCC 20476 / IMI 206040) TaxID=452589 RepID=G9P259_HYPAI|nr:uncharacterized protein TRIATDRAFT_300770 [Trichoderma atroviride IMI 206040]EHK42654.1 hypothetical protein TRIATDRAFT_300770 [Trichoderma atroviride IMI 206040]